MYCDTQFWFDGAYYRASKSGALIKGWYKPEGYINVYYYRSDYKAPNGLQTIDGKTYVFDHSVGLVMDNLSFDDEKKIAYLADSNGIYLGSLDCSKNGWVQNSGIWYFIENNRPYSNGIKKINNVYYAFVNSKMIDNHMQYVYGNDDKGYYSGMVKARPGGALVTSDWGSNNYDTFYFGSNGLALKGYQKIGNNYYYFDLNNNVLKRDGFYSIDDSKWIRVDETGKQIAVINVEKDGWKNVSNGDWVYVENKTILKDILKTIGGLKYHFGYDGLMDRNKIYVEWNSDFSVSNTLYFGNDGYPVKGWVQISGDWYYFGSDFYSYKGIKTIGKTVYAFNDNSVMQTKVILPAADGTMYSFDSQGVGSKLSPSSGFFMNKYYIKNHKAVTGWQYIGNDWYYFDKDTKVMEGLKRFAGMPITTYINGKSYRFEYDGKMLTGWIKLGNYESYARPDGSIIENGWEKINGTWYFFQNALKQIGAIKDASHSKYVLNKFGDKYKFVSQSNGWVGFDNEWFYLEDGEFIRNQTKTINGQIYGFDLNGFMIKNRIDASLGYSFDKEGHVIRNQWVEVAPKTWKYLDQNGQFYCNGWKTIGNAKYYFGMYGIIKTSDGIIDGELCRFNSDGALIGNPTKLKNGWNLVDGYWYYSKNGSLYENGFYTIGNKDYYFFDGKMAMGELITRYKEGKHVLYYFNKDGSMAKNCWCGPRYQYFAQENGELKIGLVTYGGKQYYFNLEYYQPSYIKNTSILDKEKDRVYIADKDGVIVQVLDAKNLNGWVKGSNNKYYLVLNHKFVTQKHVSRNAIYWLDPTTGIMAENEYVYLGNDGVGYANASGAISKNGWFTDIYLENGVASSGSRKIDGKDYYFSTYAYQVRAAGGIPKNVENVYRDSKGTYYYFDSKGNKKEVQFKDGWNQYNGEWYYIGDLQNYNSLTKVNGSYYGFDSNGKMLKNQFLHSSYSFDNNINPLYYVDGNGNLTKGWRLIDNNWYYFGNDYKALTGIHKIDGKEYFFDKNGVMIKSVIFSNNN